jgi:hypothetical protein
MNNPLAGTDPSGYVAEDEKKTITKEVTVVSQRPGSRIKTRNKVTVTGTSDGKGGMSVTVSGSNGAAVGQVAGQVAGKMAGSGLNVSVSDIGSPSQTAKNTPNVGTGNNGLNLNQEDYLEATGDGLWKDAPVNPGFQSNSEMQAAADKVNNKPSSSDSDIEADEDVISFMRTVAPATAKARTKVAGEKFMALGRNEKGEVIVLKIGIVTGSGGEFSIPGNTVALAHVHYKGIKEQNRPGPGDHDAVKMGLSMFMINYNGRKVVEVGRQKNVKGKFNYRLIRGGSSDWREFKGAQ